MSISAIVTLGYAQPGVISDIPRLGYAQGEADKEIASFDVCVSAGELCAQAKGPCFTVRIET